VPPKQVIYSDSSRLAMLRGVDQLADTVKVTFGPRGRNVVLDVGTGTPTITRDGVTVAKGVVLSDPFESLGAQMALQAALKTSDIAGDGTTTATILAQAIFREGVRTIAAGASPMAVKKGIDKAVEAIVQELNRISRPVSGRLIDRVGTISANGDVAIGHIVGDAARHAGKDGVITVEQSEGIETQLEIVEGMQFDQGYLSPTFVTDAVRMEATIENPYILIYEKKISAMKELLPLLEAAAKRGAPLLIIAEDVDGEALATLLVNKSRGALSVCAVKAPGFGEQRKARLHDVAILTGGRAITDDLGAKLANVNLADLGRAKRVIVSQNTTTVVGGKGEPTEIQARIRQIRTEIDKTSSQGDRVQLQERLAKMAGGVAVIKVGAPTESAMTEMRGRVQNAVHATRAAIEEGVVPGGGVALLRCSSVLDFLDLPGDANIGVGIIRRTCQEPMRQLARNAGYSGPAVVGMVLDRNELGFGFNGATGAFEDFFSSGIIDPAKVTRSALQNAASVSSLMLTAGAAIGDFPEGAASGARTRSQAKKYAAADASRTYDAPPWPSSVVGDTAAKTGKGFGFVDWTEGDKILSIGDSVERAKRGGVPPEQPQKGEGSGGTPGGKGPPGGKEPPGSDEPPEPPVYPSIDPEPEHVVQNNTFRVSVSLQWEPSAATPGEVHLPPGKRHTLDVHLLLEGNSAWDTLVWSRTHGTVKPARFGFVAPYIGVRPDGTVPDRLYVALAANFYLNGRWCGEGLRNIEVLLNGDVKPSDAIQPPKTPIWNKLLNLERGADPPDLLVRIQQVGGDMYEWTLFSPHLDLRPRPGSPGERKQLGDGAHRFVRTNFDRAAGVALEDTTIPVIEARCREIYESTPDSFKDAYWKLYAAEQKGSPVGGRGKRSGSRPPRLKSIQFISDEPYVPWELMIVREDSFERNPNRVKEEILSIRHAVGRWTAKASGQLRQRIRVQGVEVFASDYKAVEGVEPKLPWVAEERDWLEKQYGAHPGALKFQPIMQFLKEGKAQAIHFSCHGEMNVELPADSALWLEDFRKFVTAYVATEEVRDGVGREHPFVFLNACQVAGAGTQLSLVTGWPQTFLGAGASACVAPLWSVVDENAKEVATKFYRLVFEEGKTLGEALQQIRVEWKRRRSLTFLSYVLYGDPMARVEWRRQAGGSGLATV
jgi:chaperonin GroEL